MRLIAWATIERFLEALADAADFKATRGAFDAWRQEVKAAKWRHFSDLKRAFPAASNVGQRVVFNIGGNKYRMVVHPHYRSGCVYVIWLGTHKDYDKIDVVTVRFQKRR